MRLQSNGNLAIDASGQFAERQFSIKPSPAAFQILSSGLYQDKIAAVIRELSTNAFDAHVAAELNGEVGKSKVPFDVTLPTPLNPILTIRDYGTGLSEEEVFDIYTTYFGSTKQDSDDFIGALGLGSKSPFSIVSSFIVVSYYNNVKTVYTAIIGEDGFPSIVKMHSEATALPNGMEISVTVSPNDISNFTYRAIEIYKYFNVRPNFLGSNKPLIPELKYELTGNRWGYNSARANGIIATQGQVKYSVSVDALSGRLSAKAQKFLDFIEARFYDFTFMFNIGDVEIQASREALSYTPRTIKAIDEILTDVSDTVGKQLHSEVAKAKSYIDAITIVNSHKYDIYAAAAQNDVFKWQGREFRQDDNVEFIDTRIVEGKKHLVITDLKDPSKKNEAISYPKYELPFLFIDTSGDLYSVTRTLTEEVKKNNKKQYVVTYEINQNKPETIVIALNDGKVPIFKLRDCLRKRSSERQKYIIVKPQYQHLLEPLKKTLGISTHELTSTWVVGDVQRSALAKGLRVYNSKEIHYNRWGPTDNLNATSRFNDIIDITNFKNSEYRFYIVSSGSAYKFLDPFDSKKQVKTMELNEMVQTLKEIKFLNAKEGILVVTPATEKILNELYPDIKPLKECLIATKDLTREQQVALSNVLSYNESNSTALNNIISNIWGNVTPYQNFFTFVKNNSSITAFKTYVERRSADFEAVLAEIKQNPADRRYYKSILPYLVDAYGKMSKAETALVTFRSITDELNKYFPLIRIISINSLSQYKKDLITYFEFDWIKNAAEPEIVKIVLGN